MIYNDSSFSPTPADKAGIYYTHTYWLLKGPYYKYRGSRTPYQYGYDQGTKAASAWFDHYWSTKIYGKTFFADIEEGTSNDPQSDYYDDTWLWDGTSWTEMHPLHRPAGRADFGMAFDESRQQVILFGGQSYAYIDTTETWAWDGQDWIQLQAFQSPPKDLAYGAQLVYVPDLQAVMLYNAFRQKSIIADENIFAELSSVWFLNYRYLIYLPIIDK